MKNIKKLQSKNASRIRTWDRLRSGSPILGIEIGREICMCILYNFVITNPNHVHTYKIQNAFIFSLYNLFLLVHVFLSHGSLVLVL